MAGVEVIDRTFTVIEELSSNPSGVGVMQLAKETGMAPSSAHRYLTTLQQLGIVERADERRYRLTSRLFVLGLPAAGAHGLDQVTRTAIQRLAAASGETSCVMVRDGRHSVCVDRVESAYQLKIAASVGRRQDLRVGATSRLLLAYAPEEVRAEILAQPEVERLTAATVSDPGAIQQILARIRADGYYISRGEVDEGVVAVAAPVRDLRGEVVAALAVAAPQSRMGDGALQRTVELVLRESQTCSSHLGFRAAP